MDFGAIFGATHTRPDSSILILLESIACVGKCAVLIFFPTCSGYLWLNSIDRQSRISLLPTELFISAMRFSRRADKQRSVACHCVVSVHSVLVRGISPVVAIAGRCPSVTKIWCTPKVQASAVQPCHLPKLTCFEKSTIFQIYKNPENH